MVLVQAAVGLEELRLVLPVVDDEAWIVMGDDERRRPFFQQVHERLKTSSLVRRAGGRRVCAVRPCAVQPAKAAAPARSASESARALRAIGLLRVEVRLRQVGADARVERPRAGEVRPRVSRNRRGRWKRLRARRKRRRSRKPDEPDDDDRREESHDGLSSALSPQPSSPLALSVRKVRPCPPGVLCPSMAVNTLRPKKNPAPSRSRPGWDPPPR